MKHSTISVRVRPRIGVWRVKRLLSLGILSVGLVLGANVVFAQNNANSQTVNLPMKYYGESLSLRDLARTPPFVSPENGQIFENELEKLVEIPEPVLGPVTPPPLPFVQTAPPKPFAAVLGTSFEATGTGLFGFSLTGAPPDMTLAVGPRHIVTWVNSQYAVFDKSGNVLLAPVNGNTLFTGMGNVCETTNRGDPILQYDRLANRWVLSQFAFTSQTTAPWLQCIAVSTTDDPTGTYVRYSIDFGTIGFNDYGKLGVWPDAYYTAYNIFNSPSAFILALCASDRVKMLAGDPTATTLCVASGNIGGGAAFLPADLDGTTLPSDLTQGGIFIRQSTVPALRYTKLKPNFSAGTVTATDGFGGASGSVINLALPTTTRACNGNGGVCIAQPGTTQLLDTLGDRLMYRLAFRNRGGVESMIVTHSVDPDGAGARSSALRWYEIRNPLGNPANAVVALRPTIFQNGTYDPGAASDRWMGSMAMDKDGNMLAGYSIANSGTLLKPSIAVAGRLAGDAVNTLQAESIPVTGTGSQTVGLSRWGDYSTMQIDPVDDSTFWFISQYLTADGTFNWRTRVVSYSFPVTPQTIVFGANPGPLSYAPSGTFTVSATGGASGNPVTFTSNTSAVCTTGGSNGATVTIVTAGLCTIAANQAGNASFSAAPEVTQSITINRANQTTLSATSTSTSLTVSQTATLGSTGGSGTGAVSFASNNANCTVSGTTLTAAAAGGCTITATKAADTNYNVASSAALAISTALNAQAISFGANPGPQTYAPSGTFSVSATGGASGNPVSFTSSTSAVCTTGGSNGATVTIVTAGLCTIAANQAGNASFSAAPEVTQSITINRANQTTLSATSTSTSLTVSQTATLGSTGGSGTGAVSFASNNANCTVSGTTLTAAAAGGCTITATKAADTNYNVASSAGFAITTLPQQDAIFGNGFEQPVP